MALAVVTWGFVKMMHDWWTRSWLNRMFNLAAGMNRGAAFLGWCMAGFATYVVLSLFVATFLTLNQVLAITFCSRFDSSMLLNAVGALSGAVFGVLAERVFTFLCMQFPSIPNVARERLEDFVDWLKARFALPNRRR